MPALFGFGNDHWALVAEAGVDGRFAAAHLEQELLAPATIHYALPRRGETTPQGPMESGDPRPVQVSGVATPWRTVLLGSLDEIVASDLVTDLAPPSRIRRTGWIRPGVSAWSWLTENASPRSLTRQQDFVDFAARQGWEYVLLDEGWKQAGDGLGAFVTAARKRGVRILLWLNQRDLDTEAERAEELDRIRRLGVAGVKVDFFDDDTQATMRLVDELAAATARRHLLLNLHGFTVPRGLSRTWPHILSSEGVRGAEYHYLAQSFAGVVPAPNAVHDTILPFTRGVMGPVDYTPAVLTAPERTASDAHGLAMAVVLETGLLHPGDSVEAYDERPDARSLLRRLPVSWDATRLLEGSPGSGATLARRAGREWWVGSVQAGSARRVAVPLDFLAPKRRYRLTLWSDSVVAPRVVRRGDELAVDVIANGGFVARLRPLT